MKLERGADEPFIFALIRKNLPAKEPHAPETRPLNDRLVYLIIALAAIAALVFVFCRRAPQFQF